MLPIILDVSSLKVAVIGNGLQAVKRLDMLRDADVSKIDIFAPVPGEEMREAAGDEMKLHLPTAEDISKYAIIFIANLEDDEAQRLAEQAREQGVLVNVEDVKPLCDFHVPAIVRRGDMLLTASTGGKSPGLARRLKTALEEKFPADWEGRLDELSSLRDTWRAEGADFRQLIDRTNEVIDAKGWLT